jgi:hypothetical protein
MTIGTAMVASTNVRSPVDIPGDFARVRVAEQWLARLVG